MVPPVRPRNMPDAPRPMRGSRLLCDTARTSPAVKPSRLAPPVSAEAMPGILMAASTKNKVIRKKTGGSSSAATMSVAMLPLRYLLIWLSK